jgi:hypothetical protein
VTGLDVELENAAAVDGMWDDAEQLLTQLGDPLTRALAAVVVPDAAAAAPRGATGRLAGSHQAQRTSPTSAAVVNTAPYARFVHGGTRHIAPRPWLLRTLESSPWVDALAAELQAGLDQAAART